jgi:hypothetical protein
MYKSRPMHIRKLLAVPATTRIDRAARVGMHALSCRHKNSTHKDIYIHMTLPACIFIHARQLHVRKLLAVPASTRIDSVPRVGIHAIECRHGNSAHNHMHIHITLSTCIYVQIKTNAH